jgi:hypothetical protein
MSVTDYDECDCDCDKCDRYHKFNFFCSFMTTMLNYSSLSDTPRL